MNKKFNDFVKKILFPSILTSILFVIPICYFPFKGHAPLTKEEIPIALIISFVLSLFGWGWDYLKKHL